MDFTIEDLQRATGFTYRTIKKRLGRLQPVHQEGSKIFYEGVPALKAIFEAEYASKSKISLEEERAILTVLQQGKLQRELDEIDKNTVNREEISTYFSRMLTSFKSRLMAIPTKAGARFKGFNDSADLEYFLNSIIKETLLELSKPDESS